MKVLEQTPTSPSNHDLVVTEDGSVTIYSKYFDEAAHSTHGAIAETKLRFITGCDLASRLSPDQSHYIFEVGFGMGLGFLETFKLWQEQNRPPLYFVSCEIDRELVSWCQKNLKFFYHTHYAAESFSLLENLILSKDQKYLLGNYQNFNLKIYLGDILLHQAEMEDTYRFKFDSVFQDAYSPKKNPTLWTVDWFNFIKKISHQETILSTYSSSVSVRKNLRAAGFGIKNGPPFGKKKSSTIAFGNGVDSP